MTSDNERREIARKLRALADEMDEVTCDNHGEISVSLGDVWGWAGCIREMAERCVEVRDRRKAGAEDHCI